MATAQSYEAQLPSTSVDLPDGWQSHTGNSFGSKFNQFFGFGDDASWYQNALTQNNRAYEQAILKESRDYDAFLRQYNAHREDTQVQRLMADIKAAGLNPWLALQSGGVSGSSAQSQTAGSYNNVGTGSSAKAKSKESNGSSSLAMLLVATARMIAALA